MRPDTASGTPRRNLRTACGPAPERSSRSHPGATERAGFIVVVAGDHGHIALLAVGKDRRDIFRQEPAVDARPERTLDFLDFFGGLGSQRRQTAQAAVVLLLIGQQDLAAEVRSALADHAM